MSDLPKANDPRWWPETISVTFKCLKCKSESSESISVDDEVDANPWQVICGTCRQVQYIDIADLTYSFSPAEDLVLASTPTPIPDYLREAMERMATKRFRVVIQIPLKVEMLVKADTEIEAEMLAMDHCRKTISIKIPKPDINGVPYESPIW